LVYRDVPIPALGPKEVLLQGLAAGVNNTEINTRLYYYSSKVTTSTEELTTGERKKKRQMHSEIITRAALSEDFDTVCHSHPKSLKKHFIDMPLRIVA